MKTLKALRTLLMVLYLALWVGGIVAYATVGIPSGFTWAVPIFLVLGALLAFTGATPRAIAALCIAGALGYAAEVAGAIFGVPFGDHQYSQVLGPEWRGAPYALFPAWIILVAYARELVGPAPGRRWMKAGWAALWLVAIDLLIEPVASAPLALWQWLEEEGGRYYGIPLINFAGLFVVGLVIFLLIGFGRKPNPFARTVGFTVVAFFTLLAAVHGLYAAAAVGVALGLSDILLARFAFRRPAVEQPAAPETPPPAEDPNPTLENQA
jgi:putative membrane protein